MCNAASRSPGRRSSRRSVVVVAAMAMAAVGICCAAAMASPPRALAQAGGPPKLEIALFAPYLAIRTESTGRPSVRILDAEGDTKIELDAVGDRPADGRWTVTLRTPAMEPTEFVTADPGDRVSVEVDGRVTAVTVPRITADVDTAADTVSGTVPPTAGVYVVAAKDASLFGPQPAPQPVIAPAVGGSYRADLAGIADLAPGTLGYVAMVDAAQNIFAFSFAPPMVTVSPARFIALVRANADARPEVAVVDALGTEIARSGPPIAFGSGLFGIVLLRGGRPENGAFQPQPGEQVALIIADRTVVQATLPAVRATIDPESRTVSGVAPAGARVIVTARPKEAGAETVVHTAADGDGHYAAAFPSLTFADDALALALAWPGDGVAYEVAGRVQQAEVEVWGHTLTGYVAGGGELRVTHTPADGRPVAQRVVAPELDGRFVADVFGRDGQPTLFAPGDRIALVRQDGQGFELTVPRVTATVGEGGRVVAGEAPAGWPLRAEVFADDPDYFGARQVASPFVTFAGRAGADGRYALRCDGAGCPARYGRLVAGEGRVRAVLRWVDQPLSGIGVTLATAFGRATSGTAVEVAVLSGPRSGERRIGVARPTQPDQLPLWEIDLRDLFPDGIPLGTRLRLGLGSAAVDVAVAPVTWQADVLADRVAGAAPALHAVVVVVDPVDRDRAPTSVTVLAGADGRFDARFPGFNLRAGDRLYLYVIQPGAGHFLQYFDPGVVGPEEPMPVATRTPDPTMTRRAPATPPVATPTPTAHVDRRPVYLPASWR